MWVDTNSSSYPTQGLDSCITAKHCVKFIDFQTNLFLGASLYNQSDRFNTISATIMNVEMLNLKV